jgi:hypothetical protein
MWLKPLYNYLSLVRQLKLTAIKFSNKHSNKRVIMVMNILINFQNITYLTIIDRKEPTFTLLLKTRPK